MVDRETALERNELLAWLSELDFHDKQRDTFTKHHQGTGQWLLDSELFQRWLSCEQTTTLWCPGIRMRHPVVSRLMMYANWGIKLVLGRLS